jgi:DNA mismatch repair protein MSH3
MRIVTYPLLGILSLGIYFSSNSHLRVNCSYLFRTKSATRYHTPEVKKKLQERAQFKEALEAEARKAFSTFLDEIAQRHYGVLRNAVNSLAIADCLLSFARVALQEGYVRPEFTDDGTLEIVEGIR